MQPGRRCDEIDHAVDDFFQLRRLAVQVFDAGVAQEIVRQIDEPLTLRCHQPDALERPAFALRFRVLEILAEQLQVQQHRAEVVLHIVDEAAGRLGEIDELLRDGIGHGTLRDRS